MKKTLVMMLVAGIFAATAAVMPTTAAAISGTNTDYSNMSVAQLIELINQLKAQIATLTGNGGSTQCFVSDKTLSLGDGEAGDGLSGDVERLQAFLREKGFFTFSKNTGFFGKVTRTAVIAFQASVGVAQTGDFDAATREKAHAMTCTKMNKFKNDVKKEVKQEEKKKEEKEAKTSNVTSITASANGSHITWSVAGHSAQGFKVVWSKNSGPTYPTRDGDKYNYHPEASTTSSDIDAFSGAGTYHVRVCEYLGGACGVYSNELTVQLQ